MAACDGVKNAGEVSIELFRANGSYEKTVVPNLVVNSGLAWITSRMTGAPAAMSHMAIGTSNYTVGAGDQGLGAENARTPLTSSQSNGTTTTYIATFGGDVGKGDMAELGIFNAASGGTMLNRAVFAVQKKEVGDTIKVTWNVTQYA